MQIENILELADHLEFSNELIEIPIDDFIGEEVNHALAVVGHPLHEEEALHEQFMDVQLLDPLMQEPGVGQLLLHILEIQQHSEKHLVTHHVLPIQHQVHGERHVEGQCKHLHCFYLSRRRVQIVGIVLALSRPSIQSENSFHYCVVVQDTADVLGVRVVAAT